MPSLENQNNHIEGLIHEYLSGVISQKDKDELFCWLVQEPKNVEFFNQISDIWLSSSVFQNTHDFNAEEAFNRVKDKIDYVNTEVQVPRRLGIRLTWQKAAAILIPVILISSLATWLLSTGKTTHAEIPFLFEVPYGSKATVTLPDGSKVALNAGSILTCNDGFGKTNRNLNLVGEGYFNVAKNTKLPFLVRAGRLNIKAVGTSFNIKAYPEDKTIVTTLVKGKVIIEGNDSLNKPFTIEMKPKETVTYKKTIALADNRQNKHKPESNIVQSEPQTESVTPTNVPFIKQDKVKTELYTSWKDERWIIEKQSLENLSKDLERRFNIKILIVSPDISKFHFTGTIENETIEQIMAIMRHTIPINFKIDKGIVTISEDKLLMNEFQLKN
jgi:ferric-dicitrate binding protein FerR (iron transport regulator)